MRIVKPGGIAMPGILGKVKVGGKATNPQGKEYPVSLDHFRFTSNESHRVQRCVDLFGEKPTKLPITFHSNDPNVVCSQRYEFRNSSGQLVADGDGVNFRQSTKEQGMVSVSPDNGEDFMKWLKGKDPKGDWKEVLILRFMLLNYPEYGLWEFRTAGDETSIPQIIGSFDAVMELGGRVKGVPFWLTVEKHKSNRSEVARQYPVVNLTCDLSVEMVEMVNGRDIRGLVTAEKLQSALPSGEPQAENHIEDAEIVTEEPEQPAKETFIVTVSEKVEIPAEETKPEPPTEPEKKLVEAGTEDWKKAVVYIVLPDKKGSFGTVEMLETKVRFNEKDRKKLEDYEWYRKELTAGNMSMNMITAQNVNSADLEVFEQLAAMRRGQKQTA